MSGVTATQVNLRKEDIHMDPSMAFVYEFDAVVIFCAIICFDVYIISAAIFDIFKWSRKKWRNRKNADNGK